MSEPFDKQPLPKPQDPFFVLRDVRNLLERRTSEMAQQIDSVSIVAAKALAAAIGEAHDELAHDKRSDAFDAAAGLTASRMTLMCDTDLELDIRISDLARRVAERCSSALWRTHQRYITLLARPEMKPDANPVGPEALIAGLWALCNACDVSLERKLALLDQLEAALAAELPVIYGEINELLASHGIEPAQPQYTQSAPARGDGTNSGTVTSGSGGGASDVLAALQQALGGSATNLSGAPSGAVSSAGSNAALNAATLVMLNQLTTKLEQLQLASQPDSAATETEKPRALKAADLDLPPGQPEGVALETLGRIFEAIFNIWDLPDTVKTAIGRLQIPLLRLSVCDPSLFSDPQHPARKLINSIGCAALGLPREAPRSHPVSSRLWEIVSEVSHTLQGDAAVLVTPLQEVEKIIAERNAALKAIAAPIAAHLANAEAARRGDERANQWLRDILTQPSAREFHNFFHEFWVRVMAAAANANDGGTSWQEAEETAGDLMWTVLPKEGTDDRKRLAALVPGLIKRLNGGLDRINVSQETRTPFLDACFNLQTASLRGTAPTLVTLTNDEIAALPALQATVQAGNEDVAGTQLRWLNRPDRAANYRSGSGGVAVDQWLQLTTDERTTLTGFVAWISAGTGTTLLVNPDWGFALAASADYLEERRRAAKMSNLSSRAIFDLGAEEALRLIASGGAA